MSFASSEKKASIVLPGERISTIEEYLAGGGIYEDKEGYLRSSLVGVLSQDVDTKTVTVTPLPKIKTVKQGASVLGVVSSVRQDVIVVDIYGLVTISGGSVAGFVELSGLLSGLLSVAQITVEYVKDPLDYYRPGDVILAKTLNNNNPYILTTKPPQYGVLYALCSRCLSILKPLGSKTMMCSNCNNVESRKVSALATAKPQPLGPRFLLGIKRW